MGTVEIECSHLGLTVTYVDAYLVTDEGAPVQIDPGRCVSVAWSQVRDPRVIGRAVAFEIDPAPLPVQRFLLVRFSPGRDSSPHRIYQQRIAYRALFLTLASIAAVLVAVALPLLAPSLGWREALAAGGAAGVTLVAIGIAVDWIVSSGGTRSHVVNEIFVGELLTLVPNLPREPVGVSLKNVRWPRIETILPRATVGMASTLTVLALVPLALPGSITAESVNWVDVPQKPAPAAPAESAPPAPVQRVARVTGACDCAGAFDPLRGEPLPRVSLIVLGTRHYVRSGRAQTEVDLAVINNSDRDLYDLASSVEFFDQDPETWSQPTVVSRRPVYNAGPIGPGQAIKWRVDAEGSTYRIRPLTRMGAPLTGTIGPGGDGSATPGAIANLLEAHSVPVRLHGAMLLAFLDDPHAASAITALAKSLGDAESVYLGRLFDTLGDLRTCRVEVVSYPTLRRLSACVVNTTDVARSDVDLVVRALDRFPALRDPVAAPPEVLFDGTVGIPGGVAPKSGVAVEVDLVLVSLAKPPMAFEAVAKPRP